MESTVAFVELPVLKTITNERVTITSNSVAVIRGANGLCIELHENVSVDFLRKLIGACNNAQ